MRKKLFTLLLAVAASIGTMSAAITVRLDPSSCSSWSTVRLWAWTDEGNIFDSWPGQIVNQDGDGWYSYTFDASITSVSIIWNNGTYQTVDIEGVTSSTCYALNSTSGTAIKVSVVDCSSGSSQGGTPVSGKYKIGDLYYNLDATNKTAEVTYDQQDCSCNYENLQDVTIPSSVTYNDLTYNVTSIGGGAFARCGTLSSVILPESVTHIGDYAFAMCFNLGSLTLNNSVTTPGENIFGWEYYMMNIVIYVPCGTLDSYKTTEGWSDHTSRIKYASYPSYTINKKSKNGYIETTSSTDFTMCDAEHPVICTANPDRGCYFVRWADGNTENPRTIELTQDTTMEAIFDYLLTGKCGKDSALTWTFEPASRALNITGKGALSENYTYGTFIESLTIGNEITSIGDGAFAGCSGLTSVTIGNSVTSIGEGAFDGCSSLTSVVWNAKNCADFNFINSPFFNNDNDYSSFDLRPQITSFTFGNEVEHIPACLCKGMSNLTSIVIPNSVTSIGDGAFLDCGINKIYFPGTMEEWLSKSWGPGQISSSYSLYINDVAVTNVVIPNSVTSIGYAAFANCSGLTSVTIPNSVTSIGEWAFGECNNLKTVIIGSSVKVLETGAFYGCSAIETITCYGQRPPTVNQYALYGLDYSTIVYVPADYLETYKMHDAWGLYDVRPLGAKSTETTNLNVTPAETTAEVAWPAVSGAATYELVIKDKSGNVICTLIFNSNGQLTQIAFNAPSRNNAPQQTQAAGFSFTVTGLEEGTSYDLTITSKDNNGGTLDTKTVSFTTTGEPQGVDNAPSDQVPSTKLLRDGQIYIIRGDKVYNAQGALVK